MTDVPGPDEAIDAIHHSAQVEVAYQTALDLGRGLKRHDKNLTAARLRLFELIVERKPTDEERERLLWGDA